MTIDTSRMRDGATVPKKGGKMLHRLIEAMRESTATSGFEGYLRSLGARRVSGGPTVNEARKDYRAALRRR